MTYEYCCKGCDHKWETEQKITEDAMTTCPKCKQETAQRLIFPSAFVLKGSGWFKDGY